MKINTTRERLLASSMICGAALLGLSATQAAAQASSEVQEIVVTGSRIPQPNLTSVSPVAVVGSEEVKLQGTTRVEDLINNLPQAFADFGGNLANGATGTATVNLRNLGNQRTLVLIDGRRLMPGDPTQNGNGAPDLNQIPSALVDRIEVVTGGASAVYGADAVGGVVNFIMQKNFEGIRVDAQHSFFRHDNSNGTAQETIQRRIAGGSPAAQYPIPDGTVRDGTTNDVTIVMGANSPDGRGNATVYASYRNIQAITQGARDYSACTLSGGARFTCGGSVTSPTGTFDVYSADFTQNPGTYTLDSSGAGNTFRDLTGTDVYNYAPSNFYQRPDERYSLGAFAQYELTPALEVYTQLMFMDDRSIAQIAPSGVFGTSSNLTGAANTIPCSNPLLSAQQVARLCGDLGLGAGDVATVNLYRRNVEGGPRQDDLRHTAYRVLFGARGDLANDWHYDVYGQYGATIYAEKYLNEFSLSRVQRALDAVVDPATGQVVCRVALSGEDPSCVPYNVFQIGGVTPEAVNYLSVPGFSSGQTTETVVSGSIAGDLGQYGLKSPWSADGMGVALGAEYRRERSELSTDFEFLTGDLAGQGSATLPANGAYDVYELFGELRLPLISDMPFAQELTLETGYRFSDYNLGFTTDSYKFGGDWRPVDDIRFRASYQRAVRAPNIQELFRPQVLQLDGSTDPCAGATPSATQAQCALTGVSAAQYGNIAANPASQYNGVTGGNPNLDPETADTYAVGVVLTPGFLPGFTFTADYFAIKVKDTIGGVGADLAINQCIASGDPFFCGLINRAPGNGSLWQNGGYILDTTLNTGSVETKGVDVEANYRMNLADVGVGDYGSLTFNLVGTYTDSYVTEPLPGFDTYDCAGYFGTVCGTPIPEWRHKLRVSYNTPWNVQVSANWRHLGSVDLDHTSSNPQMSGSVPATDAKIKAYNYLDMSASWDVRDAITLRVGVNNLLDKDPPLIGSGNLPSVFGSGNTFPQVYDSMGQYVFVGLTADF